MDKALFKAGLDFQVKTAPEITYRFVPNPTPVKKQNLGTIYSLDSTGKPDRVMGIVTHITPSRAEVYTYWFDRKFIELLPYDRLVRV